MAVCWIEDVVDGKSGVVEGANEGDESAVFVTGEALGEW